MQSNREGKMSEEEILKIGDMIEYSNNQMVIIEKIRIISTGKFVEQYKYNGRGDNVVLTLRDKATTINLCVKDTPIRKITDKQKKR